MKFIKDLLFFEINVEGPNFDKDNITQLSAILLDKHNLLEKNSFNSYVRVSYLESVMFQHSKMLRVDYETIRTAPKIYDVAKKFKEKFGTDILLATQNITNLLYLKNAFKKAVVPFDYDLHMIELWTLGYIYTLNYGLRKMPTFHTFVDHFKLKQHNPADALEKVRLEAEIFRKIIKEV